MKYKSFLIIALILVFTFFYSKIYVYPSLFQVKNVTSKIPGDIHQDFSGAMLVNLDNEPDLEIFIAGHGSSNLFLKRTTKEFEKLKIEELADSNGLTLAITPCDLDQDGRDEILILNKQNSENNLSNSRLMKYNNGLWNDLFAADSKNLTVLDRGQSAACIDRKGNGKYGFIVVRDDAKIAFLEIVNEKIINIEDEIGIGFKAKGRSVLGMPGPQGFTNIFVGNEDGSNFYFVNDGNGNFKEKAAEYGLADHEYNARGASTIDLNNDEIPDLVYGNHKGPTRLMLQTREGKFEDKTPALMAEAYAVNSPVVGDFNLDGYEDIYLNNIRGHNKLFSRFKERWFEIDLKVMEEEDMFGISTIAADLDKNGSYEILNTHGDNSKSPLTMYSVKPKNKIIKAQVVFKNGSIPRGLTVILRTNSRDQVRVLSSGSGRFANYDNELIFGLEDDERPLYLELLLPSGKKIHVKEDLNKLSKIVIE